MIDFDTLVRPVSDSDPCGPDLDLEGNSQYLNFMVGTEQALPKSYFENTASTGDVKRFDPKTIDTEAYFATAAPILARTRDLRLIVLLAKISILGRDLASFRHCWNAIAQLLGERWNEVHPQGESGDFSYRASAIESVDALPTMIFPLQFHTLVANRRYGEVSYRAIQIARGEQAPAAGETTLDIGIIERIVDECNLDDLRATNSAFAELVETTGRIKQVWSENSESPSTLNVDRLSKTLEAISAWLRTSVERRDPSAAPVIENAESGDTTDRPDQSSPEAQHHQTAQSKIDSAAAAAAALQAASDYFARYEPSSPALLLVRQAQQMVGKSFVEVLRMMVPTHLETAGVNVGRDRFFHLPIERMAALTEPTETENGPVSNPQELVFTVETRAHALALLDRVATFFRVAEPSNPIPFLTDKARDLAQRDFITVLRDLLPGDALGSVTKDD